MQGKWVFDAGCGNGTLGAAIAKSGPTVVAMDFSSTIETAEQHKKRFGGEGWENILYIQGDVQQPPFGPKQFDVIYSDGVLHHTPDTRRSFHAVRQCLKDEGRMFVWLYRSDLKLKYLLKKYAVDMIRTPMTPRPVPVKRALCFVMACTLLTWLRIRHAVGLGGRRIIPLRQKTVNLFDTFTPSFNHRHTPREVKTWFAEEGFSNVVERTIPAIGNEGFGVLGTS
jgi:ubiquinone/menaquinone biosynthesis C-methylase UbiE